MSLTSCLARLGKNISREDRQAILDRASALRSESDGKGAKANKLAAIRAVEEHIKAIDEEIQAMKSPADEQPTTTVVEPAATTDETLARTIATKTPDLMVTIPGNEAPMPIKEALAQIAENQKRDAQWADLVRVATECALGA